MKDFISAILQSYYGKDASALFSKSPLLQYLDNKMGAIEGNSKTRRSLGNLYAIYSILYFYIEKFYNKKKQYLLFEGFEYTKLFQFFHTLYGGSKLQNHALNNRVNGEFENIFKELNGKPLIVINEGKYSLHVDFLYVGEIDISKCAFDIISQYIKLLQIKDKRLKSDLSELVSLTRIKDKKDKISSMLNEKSEARLFEIISYVILKNHYKDIKIYIGESPDQLKQEYLTLYKTGRTNANDGGIDFVMRPLGRFFQVTEVNDYDKYLLDMDKVLHFPITFVVKTKKDKKIIREEFDEYVRNKSGGMAVIEKRYFNALEEIITINELNKWLYKLDSNSINKLLSELDQYYKLEFNIL